MESVMKPKILVVDDEAGMRQLLDIVLRKEGYTVMTAATGKAALEQLAERSCDVIVTDIRMPDLDGPEFYERVIAKKPLLRDRFIFITGDSLNPRANRFIKSTNALCLDKPFRFSDLNASIIEIVKRTNNPVNEIPADRGTENSL